MTRCLSGPWPAIWGALAGLVAVPVGYGLLILSFGVTGLFGYFAYHALVPAIALVARVPVPPALSYGLIAVINAAIGAGLFMAFSVRGPQRWRVRAAALLVYAVLVCGTMTAFGNPFQHFGKPSPH